jgi:simple sugar transport system permease protein
MVELILDSIPLAIVAATPLLLAVQGEIAVQRSGMINLGIEGMMLTAAMSAVFAAHAGGVGVGFLGGIAGAAVVAAIFGFFSIVVRADQIVTGTAINLLALGATSFIYREMRESGLLFRRVPRLEIDLILPFAWILAPMLLALILWSTPVGLRLRASGENPDAVNAARHSVAVHRWIALAIEAILAGLAGAYLALELSSGFAENMTAGRGYIALAIVIFGRWKLRGALAGTALFGIAAATQYALQASAAGLPFHLMLAIPYVVTLLILCGAAGRVKAPEALGRS